MKAIIKNNYLQEYIKIITRLMNLSKRYDEDLFSLISEGCVSEYFIDYEDISDVIRRKAKSKETTTKTKISHFKKDLQKINDSVDPKSEGVNLNPELFTRNGYLKEEQAKLIVYFEKGKLYFHNKTLNGEKKLYQEDFTGLNYINFLNTIDQERIDKNVYSMELIKLFENGIYESKRGNNDHLEVGLSQRHNLKTKLNRMVDIGLCEVENNTYKLNRTLVKNYEWLQSFEEIDFTIELHFTKEGILITKI